MAVRAARRQGNGGGRGQAQDSTPIGGRKKAHDLVYMNAKRGNRNVLYKFDLI